MRLARPVLCFFALSFALSWAGNLGNALWPSDAWPVPVNPFGPIAAAPIVLFLTGGWRAVADWFVRIGRFRAPVSVYAASFFIPLAIVALAFGTTVALGAELTALPDYRPADVLLIAVGASLFGPIPEEPAFRGYALHELRRTVSPLAASLIVGGGVMVWHAPLIAAGLLPVTVLLPLAGVAVVYGRLYEAGGSVWPLVVLHAQLNIVSATVTGPAMPDPSDQAVFLVVLGAAYVAWAVRIVRKGGPALGGDRSGAGPFRPVEPLDATERSRAVTASGGTP